MVSRDNAVTLEGVSRVSALNTTLPSDTASSLRAAGLRVTPQRRAILQVLESSERPLSVEDIHHRLEKPGSGIPTIYRNLQSFVAMGWAESIPGPDQVMRFVRCHSRDHHHHLQCESCGRTVEVHACGLETGLQGLHGPSGFRVTRHQLLLFGLCPACQK